MPRYLIELEEIEAGHFEVELGDGGPGGAIVCRHCWERFGLACSPALTVAHLKRAHPEEVRR